MTFEFAATLAMLALNFALLYGRRAARLERQKLERCGESLRLYVEASQNV